MMRPSVALGGGCFYSPEVIDDSGIAFNGYTLNHVADLVGTGQHYVWYQNVQHALVNAELKHEILLYNPNAKPIVVTPISVGLTNGSPVNANAWPSYGNSAAVPVVTVPAKGYAALFKSTIHSGNPFGIVARMNVKYSDGTGEASVSLYDLVRYNDQLSVNALASAAADPVGPMQVREHAMPGPDNQVNLNQVNLNQASLNSSNAVPAFKIGNSGDAIAGADLPFIQDPAAMITGLPEGAYGRQHSLAIPVKNTDPVSRTIRIYAGNDNSSDIYINAYGYGGNAAPSGTNGQLNPGQYFDIIEDTLAPGASATYFLQIVTSAGGSGVTTVGVRVVDLT